MSHRLKTLLALLGSFALGGGLLYLAFRGADLDAMREALAGAQWGWLPVLVFLTMLSNWLRAWRWVLLVEALPEEERQRAEHGRVRTGTAFAAIMVGYMVNYAASRVGEVVRTANLSARSGRSFSGVLGTVVADRVLDVAALAVALVSVVVLFAGQLGEVQAAFTRQVTGAMDGLPVLWLAALGGGIAVMVVLLVFWWRRRRAASEPGRLRQALGGFRGGLVSILRTRNQLGLWGSTALMWFCYLWMAYLPLLLLRMAEPYDLGLLDSWALVVVGAVGMALPAPGGTGSYHFATVQTMVLVLAVDSAPAATYALLSHGAMLVMYVLVGFGCLLVQGTSLASLRGAAGSPTASDPVPPIRQPETAQP